MDLLLPLMLRPGGNECVAINDVEMKLASRCVTYIDV